MGGSTAFPGLVVAAGLAGTVRTLWMVPATRSTTKRRLACGTSTSSETQLRPHWTVSGVRVCVFAYQLGYARPSITQDIYLARKVASDNAAGAIDALDLS